MFRALTASALFAAVMALAGQAEAIVIDPTTYGGCLGLTSCSIGSATLSALPSGPGGATFDQQDFAGQKGLGINFINTGQARDPEIQGDNGSVEEVSISFASAQIITTIQLAHFYNPDEFASDPQEIAIITDAVSGTLQVLDNAGHYNLGGGLVGATATLVDASKGLWQLTNLFGGQGITSLSFQADNTPKGADNSDYSIALIQTSDVPEPTTLGLLGIGLVSFGIFGKRRRRVSKTQ